MPGGSPHAHQRPPSFSTSQRQSLSVRATAPDCLVRQQGSTPGPAQTPVTFLGYEIGISRLSECKLHKGEKVLFS